MGILTGLAIPVAVASGTYICIGVKNGAALGDARGLRT